MKILSIDPGETTGVCIAEDTQNDFEVLQMLEISWTRRFEGLEALLAGLFILPKGEPLVPEVVVIENFRLRPDKARSQIGKVFPSSKIIGMVEYLSWKYNRKLVIQEPGVRTRVKVLPEHAQMVVGSPHMVDAYQHARYYYITQVRAKR